MIKIISNKEDKNLNDYLRMSHKFALNQAYKQCLFEMKMREKYFKEEKEYSFKEFEQEAYSYFIFSRRELKKIYKKAKKYIKEERTY